MRVYRLIAVLALAVALGGAAGCKKSTCSDQVTPGATGGMNVNASCK